MIKLAVVDDNQKDRQNVISAFNVLIEERKFEAHIDEFVNANSFLFSFDCNYDIIFLDIEMPEMDGISLAHKIREKDSNVIIVFITNLAQMAICGYEVDALDFIVKPVILESFLLKMSRVLSRAAINQSNKGLLLKDFNNVKILVPLKDIYYIIKDEHYVTLYTSKGEFIEYNTLNAVEKELNSPSFTYCNRSTIVNMEHITGINSKSCFIKDIELTIARTKKREFLDDYADFIGGK